MSQRTDCVYGYGFKVYASDEALARFIKNHESSVRTLEGGSKIIDFIDDCTANNKPLDALKEDFYDYESEATGESGLYGIIADVMSEETDICFEFHSALHIDDDEAEDTILVPMLMPWQFNSVEKELTEDRLEEICKKYMAELDERLVFEDLRLEYFG